MGGELVKRPEVEEWFDHPNVGQYGAEGILLNGSCDSEDISVDLERGQVDKSGHSLPEVDTKQSAGKAVGVRPGRPSGIEGNASEVIRLRREGRSYKEIAARIGVTPVTLSRWRKLPQLQDIFGAVECVDHQNKLIDVADEDIVAVEALMIKLLQKYAASEIRLRRR